METDTAQCVTVCALFAVCAIIIGVISVEGIKSNGKFWIECVKAGNQYVNGSCLKVASTTP